MSLRVVPASTQPTKITPTTASAGAPSNPAVRDTIRSGLHSTATELNSNHPLESRLKNWDATQHALKMEGLRRLYGMHEPIRREMEMKIASSDFRPQALGGPSNVHLDILRNRDCSIDWEDIYTGYDTNEAPEFHQEMETIMRSK